MVRKSFLIATCSTTLLATNGINMIGTGTVSRSMGGTGVAYYSHGVEAINKNPALMANAKTDEVQFDLTYFNASLSSSVYDQMPLNTNPSHDAPVTADSKNHADTNFIPSLGYLHRIDEQWTFGIGLVGMAGMGADYADSPSHRKLKSAMMLMKIIPALSYRSDRFNLGFAPVLGLGSLSINMMRTIPNVTRTVPSRSPRARDFLAPISAGKILYRRLGTRRVSNTGPPTPSVSVPPTTHP